MLPNSYHRDENMNTGKPNLKIFTVHIATRNNYSLCIYFAVMDNAGIGWKLITGDRGF